MGTRDTQRVNRGWGEVDWGLDGRGSRDSEAQCVYYRVAEEQGYCIQLNKELGTYIKINQETGFILYNWRGNTVLASLSTSSLCKRVVFRE